MSFITFIIPFPTPAPTESLHSVIKSYPASASTNIYSDSMMEISQQSVWLPSMVIQPIMDNEVPNKGQEMVNSWMGGFPRAQHWMGHINIPLPFPEHLLYARAWIQHLISSSPQLDETGTLMIPIFQMRQVREVQAQGVTAKNIITARAFSTRPESLQMGWYMPRRYTEPWNPSKSTIITTTHTNYGHGYQ